LREEEDKFRKEVERAFPPIDVKTIEINQLNKLNEKISTMIRRFNEQLNDIINKNALLIRMNERNHSIDKTLDEKLKLLE
jgi:hypothetical protein